MAGQKINDHSAWCGKSSKESPLPMGCKMKQFNSAEGAGEVMKYEDTTEAIKAGQMEGNKKIKAHPMKQPNYRN